jgi:hypothetical protein
MMLQAKEVSAVQAVSTIMMLLASLNPVLTKHTAENLGVSKMVRQGWWKCPKGPATELPVKRWRGPI